MINLLHRHSSVGLVVNLSCFFHSSDEIDLATDFHHCNPDFRSSSEISLLIFVSCTLMNQIGAG